MNRQDRVYQMASGPVECFASTRDVVLADGIVEQDEKELLNNLMIALELDSTRAMTIVRVMVLKNKG